MWLLCIGLVIPALPLPTASPAADLARFPPLEVCTQALDLNNKCQDYIRLKQAEQPRYYWEYEDILTDLATIWDAWIDLQLAWSPVENEDMVSDPPLTTNNALKWLKKRLGEQAWCTGHMPAPVPEYLWYSINP